MPGPYGIEQVDVPGLLGLYQNTRHQRMQDMLIERQIKREDRQLERENSMLTAYSKFLRPQDKKGGDPASASAAPSTSPGGAAPAPGAPQAAPQPPQGAGAPYNPMMDPARRQELLATVSALDPKQAMELIDQFSGLDKAQQAQMKGVYETIGGAALHLQQIPEPERAAELQRIAPDLIALGVPQETLARQDLSDRGLSYSITQIRDVEKVLEGMQPKLRNVAAGDVLYDERKGEVTYESPYVKGADGQLYRREPSAPTQAPVQVRDKAAYDALPPGTPYIAPDGSQRVKGGASQPGSQTFPEARR